MIMRMMVASVICMMGFSLVADAQTGMIQNARNVCAQNGFRVGTESFARCVHQNVEQNDLQERCKAMDVEMQDSSMFGLLGNPMGGGKSYTDRYSEEKRRLGCPG